MKKAIILAGLVIPVVMACGKKSSSSSNSGPVFPAEVHGDYPYEPCKLEGDIEIEGSTIHSVEQFVINSTNFVFTRSFYLNDDSCAGPVDVVVVTTSRLTKIVKTDNGYDFDILEASESSTPRTLAAAAAMNQLSAFGITTWSIDNAENTFRKEFADGSPREATKQELEYDSTTEEVGPR